MAHGESGVGELKKNEERERVVVAVNGDPNTCRGELGSGTEPLIKGICRR